jgi:hypothetical protein
LAQSLPYLASNKNLGKLFERILTSQRPSVFTHDHLQNIIGLKSTNDRLLIPLLRNLGFLDSSNRPTATFNLLKNGATAKTAIANGIKTAYEPLFRADEKANQLTGEPLKGLISQVSGEDEDAVNRIASTFSALVKLGDFSGVPQPAEKPQQKEEEEQPVEEQVEKAIKGKVRATDGLRPDFHYNIQIHLPANGTEETYLNIFNALRRTFK